MDDDEVMTSIKKAVKSIQESHKAQKQLQFLLMFGPKKVKNETSSKPPP
jgi:hypothetical protein